ncbi:hypothetical protein BQ8794_50272 [Mesorhizobium prunaredense]|uniref:Uncharacterized protein n=1 Tax=Mesorhizobium prunaredense TaxID=1631249 RepID=A0A1R3VIE1_9HYPH|nr:hypothetical protein [Mesorhizobium prunaredense]SIT58170.1 hypothetical protein BQ8794_50272 [Mesorhizobium prunaredense]
MRKNFLISAERPLSILAMPFTEILEWNEIRTQWVTQTGNTFEPSVRLDSCITFPNPESKAGVATLLRKEGLQG